MNLSENKLKLMIKHLFPSVFFHISLPYLIRLWEDIGAFLG